MEINTELLSKILSGDSSSNVNVLHWHIDDKIIAPGNSNSSEVSRLTVEYQKKGKTFKKSFILKVPSTHPMYDIGKQWGMYEKEHPMYVEVLEEMYKLDGEHIGAKLYYTDDKYSLVLKDLSSSGYKMMDRTEQLDFHQCYAVLKCLAKFHALSVKLDQQSKISAAIKRIPWLENARLLEQFAEYMTSSCDLLAKYVDSKFGWDKKILQIKNVLYDKVREEFASVNRTLKVLNHGDCWLGNTLFKFDKYGNVSKVKLIDFQYLSWSPPVFDILVFTITSMRFDVFEKHFDILMETYVETFNKTMEFYQCGSYCSKEQLRRDMDNLPGNIMLILCVVLPRVISSHEEPWDFQRFLENGNAYYENFFKNEIYLKVVNQWISYYDQKGLFDWK